MNQKVESDKVNNRYIVMVLALTGMILFGIAAMMIYLDPFFHYHAPLKNIAYNLGLERYQNDGIMRYFEYEGIITGTSMTENFKASQAKELFGVEFVKVPFGGGRYKEIDENLRRAYEEGKEIKYVIRGLDNNALVMDKEAMNEEIQFPKYLTNENILDDVNYVLNKSAVIQAILAVLYTIQGKEMKDFDEYMNWMDSATFGKETVLSTYMAKPPVEVKRTLSNKEKEMIVGNIQQNVISLAKEHPETEFYLFFTPYSICFWDVANSNGEISWMLEAEKIAIEEMLQCENIRLYSFADQFEWITDLNNYRDLNHYAGWINDLMLEKMHAGENLLTKDNYLQYLEKIEYFYLNYDYESLHR